MIKGSLQGRTLGEGFPRPPKEALFVHVRRLFPPNTG